MELDGERTKPDLDSTANKKKQNEAPPLEMENASKCRKRDSSVGGSKNVSPAADETFMSKNIKKMSPDIVADNDEASKDSPPTSASIQKISLEEILDDSPPSNSVQGDDNSSSVGIVPIENKTSSTSLSTIKTKRMNDDGISESHPRFSNNFLVSHAQTASSSSSENAKKDNHADKLLVGCDKEEEEAKEGRKEETTNIECLLFPSPSSSSSKINRNQQNKDDDESDEKMDMESNTSSDFSKLKRLQNVTKGVKSSSMLSSSSSTSKKSTNQSASKSVSLKSMISTSVAAKNDSSINHHKEEHGLTASNNRDPSISSSSSSAACPAAGPASNEDGAAGPAADNSDRNAIDELDPESEEISIGDEEEMGEADDDNDDGIPSAFLNFAYYGDDDDDDDARTGPRFSDQENDDDDDDSTVQLTEDELKALEKPAHTWNLFLELRKREFGTRAQYGNCKMNRRAIGSRHMVERLSLMHKLDSHQGCVNCLNFNRTGSRLASGSDDTNIIIWDWMARRPAIKFESGHHSNVFQAKFVGHSGDCHLVSAARDGQIRLAELSLRGVCKSTRKLAQHNGSSHKLALSDDSPHLVLSCGEDGVVFEIDLREPTPHKIVVTRPREGVRNRVTLYSINSNPSDVNQFVTSGRDPYLRVYDRRYLNAADDYKPVRMYAPLKMRDADTAANATCVVYNYNGTEIIGSYNDDDIYLFDATADDERDAKHSYSGHLKGVNFYGAQSEYIVSGSDCGHIFFWEKESEKIVQYVKGDQSGVINVLEPHPTTAVLATSGLDHDVKVWAPVLDQPHFNAKRLHKIISYNKKERERSENRLGSGFDEVQIFRLFMRRMMQSRRNDAGNNEEDDDDDVDDDTPPELFHDDRDEDEPAGRATNCRTQ